LDEKIDPKEAVLSLRFCLGRFSKEEITGVEKENGLSFLFHLIHQGRFLGHTAKGIPKSPAGFNLSHHVIGIDQGEFNLRCGVEGRRDPHGDEKDGQDENHEYF
jgi:hypothetical protein